MERILTMVLFLSLCCLCNAQTYVVQSFGTYMTSWANNNDISSLESLDDLCASKKYATRVSDKIARTLATKHGIPYNSTYTFESYTNWLQSEIDKGITISFSKIEPISKDKIDKQYDKPELEYATCNVNIQGSFNINTYDLFYIQNGRIVKIDDYVEETDPNTGKKHIKIDLSGIDLEDTETYGLMYNYSKHFPLGGSFTYTFSKFLVSVDVGYTNAKDNKIVTCKADVTNIMNYTITKGEYFPKIYCTITPALYMKYFAIGCGFGFVDFTGKETISTEDAEYYADGNSYSGYNSKSEATSNSDIYKYMIRPTIKGYIPCNDNLFIAVSVAYNYIFKYTKMNEFSFGLGVQYNFNFD